MYLFPFDHGMFFFSVINIPDLSFAYFCLFILFDTAVDTERIWCLSKRGIAWDIPRNSVSS